MLLKAKGKCTTDHISAAGPWLKYRGHLENISGNLFLGVVNAFTGATRRGQGPLDGETRSFPDIAKHYARGGHAVGASIGDQQLRRGVVARARGDGAAVPRRPVAIFARSFARIHETNLKKQGMVPLTFADPATYDADRRGRPHRRARPAAGARVSPCGARSPSPTAPPSTSSAPTRSATSRSAWFDAGSALNIVRAKVAAATPT